MMTISVTCPDCAKQMNVREEHAGKKVRCPGCQGIVPIPALPTNEDDHGAHVQAQAAAAPPPVPAPRPSPEERPRRKRKGIRCPECGEMNHPREERCQECGAYLDEEDDARIQHRAYWKPCPRCGEEYADRVTWTPWGSFYGPALFSHVRCRACKYAYNGRTGRSNLVPALLFVLVPGILILGILGFLFYILFLRN